MRRVLLVLVLLLSTIGAVRASDFEEGLAAYDREDCHGRRQVYERRNSFRPSFGRMACKPVRQSWCLRRSFTLYWWKKYGSGPEADRARAQFFLA